MNLDGRLALIKHASSGFGAKIARQIARASARIAVNVVSEERVERTLGSI
jgi:NAD(P)-dependent dehydrogenase (short-subunit alcohol dehydrogenase family)